MKYQNIISLGMLVAILAALYIYDNNTPRTPPALYAISKVASNAAPAEYPPEGHNLVWDYKKQGFIWALPYKWDLKEDITVYELALIFKESQDLSYNSIHNLPPEAKRHFKQEEP